MSYEQLAEAVNVLAESNAVLTEQVLATQEASNSAVEKATAQAELAEQSAVEAQTQVGAFATVGEGLAKTVSGQLFGVKSGSDSAVLDIYENSAGVAILTGKQSPSANLVKNAATAVGLLKLKLTLNGLTMYKGTGPDIPLFTDLDGRALLRWSVPGNKLIGPGILTKEQNFAALAEKGVANYTGAGSVTPVLRDKLGRVLLGYDASTDRVIGAGLSSSTGGDNFQPLPQVPLPTELTPIAKTVNHFLFYGQSLATGATSLPLLSVTQPYSNITFAGGPRGNENLTSFKPLVEDAISPAPDGGTNRGETPCSGAANYATLLAAERLGLATNGHVIFASTAAHGGYRISLLVKGSAWYQQVIDQVTAAKAVNTNYAVHAIGWLQGENDAVTGGVQTPYAVYRATLEQLQVDLEADIKAITGQLSPVFMITYQMSYASATWPDIAKAHLDLAQKNAKFFLSTPMYHFPYSPDRVHLTNVGSKWAGAYFGRAYERLVNEGVEPQWIYPISAVLTASKVRVKFSVPYPPLLLDNVVLAATLNYGFIVKDAVGTSITISSIEVVNGTEVSIELASTPTTPVTVRYALDNAGVGVTVTGGASGNLRDSDPATVSIDGAVRPMFNVCPHFELPAISNKGI